MKIKLLAIGKQKKSPQKELVDYYLKISKWKIDIAEIEIKNFSSPQHRKTLEAKEILQNIDGFKVISLDERGKSISSQEFANMVEKYQDRGDDICFVIGGSDGLDESIRNVSSEIISFGRMTMPHMLVRAVLCEQIYRAGTIIEGHPYNK